jgi:protein-L-isoaspartate(D-aspartate) O-methyltransferase
MHAIPRESFVAPALAAHAYEDRPLPIGDGQTISQPYIVALMTEALGLVASDRVLEVGTGCGYAAAVLAQIAERVYTIERKPKLAAEARYRLARLGYRTIEVRCGDGTLGWPEHAPYDAIVVAAAGPEVPVALCEQLEIGGRLVMPIENPHEQRLVRLTCLGPSEYRREELQPVVFVPLIGAQGLPDPERISAHAIGQLCVGGDWACAHGDLSGLRDVAQRLAEQVPEPLHCELVALADACHADADHAPERWAQLKELVYRELHA